MMMMVCSMYVSMSGVIWHEEWLILPRSQLFVSFGDDHLKKSMHKKWVKVEQNKKLECENIKVHFTRL